MAPDDAFAGKLSRAYELGRARDAALAASPAILYPVVALWLGGEPLVGLIGAVAVALAFLALQRGGGWARGVYPGLAAGLIPFTLTHLAQSSGHSCATGGCLTSWCLPACAVGGFVGGFVVAQTARRSAGGLRAWASGAALVLAAGAMGCACLGYSSLAGLAAGLLVAGLSDAGVRAIVARRG